MGRDAKLDPLLFQAIRIGRGDNEARSSERFGDPVGVCVRADLSHEIELTVLDAYFQQAAAEIGGERFKEGLEDRQVGNRLGKI